jgi:hypothetical protein
MEFEVLKLPLKVFKVFGIWTTKESLMHLIFLDLYLVLMGMYLMENKTFIDFAQLMTGFLIYVSCAIKTAYTMMHADEIEELMEMIKETLKTLNTGPIGETQFQIKIFPRKHCSQCDRHDIIVGLSAPTGRQNVVSV